jgi:hypothetical protein
MIYVLVGLMVLFLGVLKFLKIRIFRSAYFSVSINDFFPAMTLQIFVPLQTLTQFQSTISTNPNWRRKMILTIPKTFKQFLSTVLIDKFATMTMIPMKERSEKTTGKIFSLEVSTAFHLTS